jgi:hypothetical protein
VARRKVENSGKIDLADEAALRDEEELGAEREGNQNIKLYFRHSFRHSWLL